MVTVEPICERFSLSSLNKKQKKTNTKRYEAILCFLCHSFVVENGQRAVWLYMEDSAKKTNRNQ